VNVPIQALGMAWYKRANYLRLRAVFEDGHKLHGTYDEWFAAAETGRKHLEAEGFRVIRVDIDPDRFPAWCRAQGHKINSSARTTYVNWVAHRMISGTH
jgi:hypothetical protein